MLGSSILFSQEKFQVLQVFGEIRINSSNKLLKIRDTLSGNPTFNFSNETDKALLLSNFKGRVVLFKNKIEKEPDGKLIYYLKNNILPFKDYTGSRGYNNNISYLFFDKFKLIIPKKIKVFKVPESSSSFYQIRYNIANKNYTKKLIVNPDGYFKLESRIFEQKVSSKQLPEQIKIYYYDNTTDSFKRLKNLNYLSINIQDIKEEIDIYKNWLLENKNKEIDAKLKKYLRSVYGNDLNLNHLKS